MGLTDLGCAASLPGKTLHVGIALWWLHGISKGKPFKLTQKALQTLNVERDATSSALTRLEQAGLIRVVRQPGHPGSTVNNPLPSEFPMKSTL